MSPSNSPATSPKVESFYDLTAELKNGKTIDFSEFRGKVRGLAVLRSPSELLGLT